MFRAALSGTNWTGKSITVETFVSRNSNVSIETHNLSVLVKKCPYPMIKGQTLDGSRWMINEVAKLVRKPDKSDIQLFDRSPIDLMAFTLYAMDRGKVMRDDELIDSIVDLFAYFNHLFFCERSSHWPMEKQSQQDIAFARLMEKYMRDAINRFSIKITKLPWDLEERQKVLQSILL